MEAEIRPHVPLSVHTTTTPSLHTASDSVASTMPPPPPVSSSSPSSIGGKGSAAGGHGRKAVPRSDGVGVYSEAAMRTIAIMPFLGKRM